MDRDLNEMRHIFSSYLPIEKVILYGSRAKGNYKNGSDVDLSVLGQDISDDLISELIAILNEESMMPYHFDVVNYHKLTNSSLINHIDRIGKTIYTK